MLNQGEQTSLKFNSFTFAFVVNGNGNCEIQEYGSFKMNEFNAYYILPQVEFTITNNTESKLEIFLANCDF